MKKAVLIGTGYWGNIIYSKLVSNFNLVTTLNSKDYNPELLSGNDWAFIATPSKTHYSIAEDCLNAGCNIFIEKPFCDSHGQALSLLSLSKILHLYGGVPFSASHQ